ncbi:MAG: hypothetical protein ACFCUH_04225 [Flavobacteriales bacterium]|jgi:hypothetical protein
MLHFNYSTVRGVLADVGKTAKSSIKLVSAVLMLAFFSLTAHAQAEPPKASLSQAGILQLPADAPLSSTYLVDLSNFNFSSEQEMVSFFAGKANDHFAMRAIPHLNQAIVYLQVKKNANWSVTQWNAFLSQETNQRPIKQ